ncbi:hypothetical protein CGH01_24985, partial [Vibrio parahaemolyticus]
GATGSMAEVLWTELKVAIESEKVSFPKNLENALLSLGDSSLSFDEIKKTILEIVSFINKGARYG